MYHYVYYSYEEWGRGYIGVRSCKCLPEEDSKYFGSFKDEKFKPTSKIILIEFPSRQKAVEAEILLHDYFEVHVNKHFANQAKQTAVGYDRKDVPISPEVIAKYKEAYDKFRIRNPESYERRKQSVLEGIKKFRANNPDKVKEQLVNRSKKGGEGMARRRKEDSEFDLKLRKAVSDSMQYRFTPEYQQMLINRAREATAKPVIVTYPDGTIQEFATLTECGKTLRVSPQLLHKKLANLPTRKLKDLKVEFKVRLSEV